jgi:type II secretory pathway pseudopilin PulG
MAMRKAPRSSTCRQGQAGMVLIALLIVLALLGVSLASVTEAWSLSRQREQEQQLLFAGAQYRQAIMRYYQAAPRGTPKVLPKEVKDLLEDDRFPTRMQHLRRPYADPMAADGEWGEIRIAGRLAGVYSKSERAPVKVKGFAAGYEPFEGRTSYREWVFAVSPLGRPTFINPDAVPKPDSTNDPIAPPRSAHRTPS